jgi:hypothetical protein
MLKYTKRKIFIRLIYDETNGEITQKGCSSGKNP